MSAGRRDFWIDAAWLMALGIWSGAWCLTAAAKLGPTYDEPFYLTAGIEGWHTWPAERAATHGVMPLPLYAATLPLHAHEQRTGQPIGELLDHLPRARAVTLFWLGLLIVSAFRLGRAAGGPWAGRVASGLIAADPTFLAHSSLATTDVATAAVLMAFARVVYVGRSGGWWWRVLLPGLWFGVAAVTKLSGLLYGGLILVALEVAYRFSSGALGRPTRPRPDREGGHHPRSEAATQTSAGRAGESDALPHGRASADWARHIAAAVVRSVLAVAAVVAIGIGVAILACGTPEPGVRPMAIVLPKIPDTEPLKPRYAEYAEKYDQVPYAVVTFAFQWWHNSQGRPAFLNGTYYPEGCWFHFPVLLAMKTPLPVMLLALLALLRPRAALNAPSVAAFALLLVTLEAKLQTGVRHVLPVMAIGYVAVAVAVCRGFGRVGVWLGFAAVAVMAGTSAWVWPHGLGYLNQLAGGPDAAVNRVSDSNLDWGQGLPDLIEWHKANGEPKTALWYFGTDPAAHHPPFVLIPFERMPTILNENDFVNTVDRKLLAVGTTVLTLHPFDPPPKAVAIKYLRTRKPMARTATFVIYDFRDPAGPPPLE